MARILVVEDDTVINQIVAEFLKEQQHDVVSVFDGQAALEQMQKNRFHLVILDIMIPKITGLEVLQTIRKTSDVPVMMLTAMDDEYTQLVSFNHLISDYVVKPFSPLILMKRVENILRQQIASQMIQVGEVAIDTEHATAYLGKEALPLTKKEYDILALLANHKGKVVTRDQLMDRIWGYEELDSRVLDNHIKNLRKKVPQVSIKTIIGRGYQLEEETH